MSVATQLTPSVYVPPRALPARPRPVPAGGERLADVITLYRPSERSIAPPVRLTRRGVAVVSAAVALLAVGLVWLAWRSAPPETGGSRPMPATVVVHDGDTLWSIATEVAPSRDPRAEVAELQRINHLSGVSIAPGQVLRTH